MSGLDTRLIPSTYFQEYFVDKDTGLPLAAGVVSFYKDRARTQAKVVYQISGTPPNYTYTSIGAVLTLSANGTFQDLSGNDIIPYFFPYDGTPASSNGDLELYYITVYSAGAVFQFSREGEPNIASTSEDTSQIKNYVPNGQFLIHQDLPNSGLVTTTGLSMYGGWLYTRSTTSSTDYITFERYSPVVYDPTGTPRYTCRIRCTTAGSDTYKYLEVVFNDVNKFSKAGLGDTYTFSFAAKCGTSSTLPIKIYIDKYYGSGGTPSVEEFILQKSLSISDTITVYNVPITFPGNESKSLGTDNNDAVSVAISLPINTTFDFYVTDVALVPGSIKELPSYPIQTTSETIYKSLGGFIGSPAYDGADLYLPLILTHSGISYDRTHIGRIYTCSGITNQIYGSGPLPMILCDGTSFDVSEYSSIGIPYRRLFDYLRLGTDWTYAGQALYGTGIDRCTAMFSGITTDLILVINAPGSTEPNAIDGAAPTGFTFTNSTVYSGFKATNITCLTGALTPANSYLKFYDNLSRVYVVWYKKDGTGTQPTVTGAYKYIETDITTAMTANQVRDASVYTINAQYFAVPDYRGKFLRCDSFASGRDPDRATRTSSTNYGINSYFGSLTFGTNQAEEIHKHQHGYTLYQWYKDPSYIHGTNGDEWDFEDEWTGTGEYPSGGGLGDETRPLNQYVICYIGY